MSDLATNRDLLLWSEIWKKSKTTDRRRVSAKKPLLEIKQMSAICLVQVEVFRWRSGWDSNPRAVAGKLISSHFSLMIFSGNYAKMEVHNGSQNSAVYCGFRLPFFAFI